MKLTVTHAAAVLGVVLLAILAGAYYLQMHSTAASESPVPVSIGTPPIESAALVYIADDRGYFTENGLNVTIVSSKTAIDAIDALATQNLDVPALEKRLGGNNLVVWPAQNHRPCYAVLACREDWIAHNPDSAERLLKALSQAEDYLISNPDDARSIIERRIDSRDQHRGGSEGKHEISLTLDRSLITAMEDEGRWILSNNLSSAGQLPDFREYVYGDGLGDVAPAAVNFDS